MNRAGKKALSFTLVMLLALAFTPLTAFAVNLTLHPSDSGGINSVVSTVASTSDTSNTITLNLGIYNKTTDRNNNITFNGKQLLIQGDGGPGDVIIDGQSQGYLFNITGDGGQYPFEFANLTFTNGDNGGNGGAIYNAAGTVDISGCTFGGNFADRGGAIYNAAGTVDISGCIFNDNFAGGGGGVYNDTGTVNITGCTFSNNVAVVIGGDAIYNEEGTVNIVNSAVTGSIYNSGTLNINYGSTVSDIFDFGTTNFEVVFGVTGSGGSLTAAAGGSAIATGDYVESGSRAVFSAVPDSGYRVKQWTVTQWSDDGSAVNPTGDSYDIDSLNSPYKVTVEFELLQQTPETEAPVPEDTDDSGSDDSTTYRTVRFFVGGELYATKSVEDGTFPRKNWPANPSVDGFGGWFTGKDGAGTQYTDTTLITKDIDLYAKITAAAVPSPETSDSGSVNNPSTGGALASTGAAILLCGAALLLARKRGKRE